MHADVPGPWMVAGEVDSGLFALFWHGIWSQNPLSRVHVALPSRRLDPGIGSRKLLLIHVLMFIPRRGHRFASLIRSVPSPLHTRACPHTGVSVKLVDSCYTGGCGASNLVVVSHQCLGLAFLPAIAPSGKSGAALLKAESRLRIGEG